MTTGPVDEPVDPASEDLGLTVINLKRDALAEMERRFPPLSEEAIARMEERTRTIEMRQQQVERNDRIEAFFSSIGRKYHDCKLSNYEIQHAGQEYAVKALRNFADNLEASNRGLVLYGPCGTGKDHLLAAMMRLAIVRFERRVTWRNGVELFSEIRDRIGKELSERSLIHSLVSPDILAISDPVPPLGALTEFQASMLFQIIDGRDRQGHPTWITLNCANRKEAEQRMSAQIVERLIDGALVLHCNWPSYRKPAD